MLTDPRSSTNFKQKYQERNCTRNITIKLMKMCDKEKSSGRNKNYDLQRDKHKSDSRLFTRSHTNQKIVEGYF